MKPFLRRHQSLLGWIVWFVAFALIMAILHKLEGHPQSYDTHVDMRVSEGGEK